MYKVRISKKAEKQIKRIKKIHQLAILSALQEIKEEPFIGKPLSRELTNRFTYKISVYRIVYKINKTDKIVDILSAGHRSTVYN